MKRQEKLTNLTDLHSHILYGVDDGSTNLDETLTICNMYIENGFNKVVATPHNIRGTKFCVDPDIIIKKVNELNQLMTNKGIPLKIFPGMEIMLDIDTVVGLKDKNLITINASRYVLVESPAADFPDYAIEVLALMQGAGFIPVLAHPERNLRIMADINFSRELFNKGIIFQISKGSILGQYGKKVKVAAHNMLKEGLVHVIATDTHREKNRTPSLGNLQDILFKIIGSENTEIVMRTNPGAIIEDGVVIGIKVFKKLWAAWVKVLWVVAVGAIFAGACVFFVFNK